MVDHFICRVDAKKFCNSLEEATIKFSWTIPLTHQTNFHNASQLGFELKDANVSVAGAIQFTVYKVIKITKKP